MVVGAGCLLASLVAAIAIALATSLRVGQFSLAHLGLVPVFFIFAFVAMILIGLPIYLLLSSMRLVTWWSSLFGGFFGGAIVGLILRLPAPPLPSDFLVTCPVGGLSALAFWLVLRSENASSKVI